MKIRQFINNNYLIVVISILIAIFLLIVAIANAQNQSNEDAQIYGHRQNKMHINDRMGDYGRGHGNDYYMHP